MDILDVLPDEDNNDPIVLTDRSGKTFSFEQIAVIPYNDKIYAVLHPIDKIEGVGEDEAVVFYVDETREPKAICVETDEPTARSIFTEYYRLIGKKFEDGNG